MRSGDVKKTKGNGGSGKSSSGVCSFGRNCKFGKKGMCNKGSCEAQAFWVSKNSMVPAVPAGYQLVPIGNQMVPAGSHPCQSSEAAAIVARLEHFADDVYNKIGKVQQETRDAQATADGAQATAEDAKATADAAIKANQKALDSIREDLARESAGTNATLAVILAKLS